MSYNSGGQQLQPRPRSAPARLAPRDGARLARRGARPAYVTSTYIGLAAHVLDGLQWRRPHAASDDAVSRKGRRGERRRRAREGQESKNPEHRHTLCSPELPRAHDKDSRDPPRQPRAGPDVVRRQWCSVVRDAFVHTLRAGGEQEIASPREIGVVHALQHVDDARRISSKPTHRAERGVSERTEARGCWIPFPPATRTPWPAHHKASLEPAALPGEDRRRATWPGVHPRRRTGPRTAASECAH